MAAVSPKGRPVTAEEFVDIASRLERSELVEGAVFEMGPTSGRHGEFEIVLASELHRFVKARGLGKVYVGEVGFIIRRSPDTVRGADIAFLPSEKAALVPKEGFVPFAPELVIEIVSPGDRWSEIRRKVEEWLSAGTKVVWVVDPARQAIEVNGSQGQRSLSGDDTLTGEDVLPGFEMPLRDLFES